MQIAIKTSLIISVIAGLLVTTSVFAGRGEGLFLDYDPTRDVFVGKEGVHFDFLESNEDARIEAMGVVTFSSMKNVQVRHFSDSVTFTAGNNRQFYSNQTGVWGMRNANGIVFQIEPRIESLQYLLEVVSQRNGINGITIGSPSEAFYIKNIGNELFLGFKSETKGLYVQSSGGIRVSGDLIMGKELNFGGIRLERNANDGITLPSGYGLAAKNFSSETNQNGDFFGATIAWLNDQDYATVPPTPAPLDWSKINDPANGILGPENHCHNIANGGTLLPLSSC